MHVLRLLGGASLAGSAVRAPVQRHQIAVLALLSTAPSARVSRDRIVALVWPESPASMARHSLNVALHGLRKALGEGVIRSVGADLELDFAVLPMELEPNLPSLPLFEDSWVSAVWTGHPHLGAQFTMEEFLAVPHLSFRLAGPDHGSIAESYLTQLGFELKIVASTESFATAPFLLRETPFATLVPRRLGERLRRAADIRLVELPLDIPPLREKLIWSPRYTASPAHAWFRARIAEVAEAL